MAEVSLIEQALGLKTIPDVQDTQCTDIAYDNTSYYVLDEYTDLLYAISITPRRNRKLQVPFCYDMLMLPTKETSVRYT